MQALSQQLIDALNKQIEWIYRSLVSEFLTLIFRLSVCTTKNILPLVPFAFSNGFRPKVAQEWLPLATWSSAIRIVLFARQNRRRAREREGQANEAARMVPVRCHQDSLTLRFRRC